MAVLNPSFEDAGALPGQAEHWTLVAVCSKDISPWFPRRPST